jgi:hypothetical protein
MTSVRSTIAGDTLAVLRMIKFWHRRKDHNRANE